MEVDVGAIVGDILGALGAPFKEVRCVKTAGQEIYCIETDDAKVLIGSHGDTIHALDHIVKKIVEKRLAGVGDAASAPGAERGPMFLVDVNDYRGKQIKELQNKALMMAGRARSFQYDVELSPMSAYERLIVHTTLQDAPNVRTESQGEGRNRRVVIKYAAE